MILTHGAPWVSSAGKLLTLSSTMTSGSARSRIAWSCSWQYTAPSISEDQTGSMNVPSCSIVGLRNSGAVSATKSIQNWPASWSPSAGGERSTRSSSKPEGLELALPRRLGREHDAVPPPFEHLADADAVVRRPVGALGHEHDRAPFARHDAPHLTPAARTRVRPNAPSRSLVIERYVTVILAVICGMDRAVVGERPHPAEASAEGLAGRQGVVPQARVRRRRVGPVAAVHPPDDGPRVDREVPRTEREVDDPHADDLRRNAWAASPLVRADRRCEHDEGQRDDEASDRGTHRGSFRSGRAGSRALPS